MAAKPCISIGSRRHRLAIQANTPTRDAVGGQTDAYATYATVWGSLRPMRGLELVNAQQNYEEVTMKAVIRYRSDIVPSDRIVFETRTLEIVGIIDYDEIHQYQELLLKEII